MAPVSRKASQVKPNG